MQNGRTRETFGPVTLCPSSGPRISFFFVMVIKYSDKKQLGWWGGGRVGVSLQSPSWREDVATGRQARQQEQEAG